MLGSKLGRGVTCLLFLSYFCGVSSLFLLVKYVRAEGRKEKDGAITEKNSRRLISVSNIFRSTKHQNAPFKPGKFRFSYTFYIFFPIFP